MVEQKGAPQGTPPDAGGGRAAPESAAPRGRRGPAAPQQEQAPRLERIGQFFASEIWQWDAAGMPTFRKAGVHLVRLGFLLLRGLKEHQSFFRASGLTYITVLSLVPLLAFAFALAKGFGAYDHLVKEAIVPFLDNTFGRLEAPAEPGVQPRAEEGREEALEGAGDLFGEGDEVVQLREVFDKLLEFVGRTNVANLGAIGLVVLMFTVLKLLGHVENSMNAIWGVTRSRTLVRKFADYLSLVVITPLLVIAATALAAAFQSSGFKEFVREKLYLGPFVELGLAAVPFLGIWLAFALLYLIMPNTRVRVRSAALGGFLGALAWTLFQVLHVQMQLGVAQYNTLYASFAAFPLFLLWVWSSWVSVLLGAELAYADQHAKTYLRHARAGSADQAWLHAVALRIMLRATQAFVERRPPLAFEPLFEELGISERHLREALDRLERAGLLVVTEDRGRAAQRGSRAQDAWALGADPDRVRASDVLIALDGQANSGALPSDDPLDERADRTLSALAKDLEGTEANRTLKELVS